MGEAIASQHPAVVLRSHYTLVRALLAVALIAVVGLTVAVVILATDGDEAITSQTPNSAAAESPADPQAIQPPGQRYDGGPEEGTRGIVRSDPAPQVSVNPSTGYASGAAEAGTQDVAPPPSSIAAAEAWRYAQLRAAGAEATGTSTKRYDGGPEEGTRGPTPCCGHRP
jgi:hypothetical protein